MVTFVKVVGIAAGAVGRAETARYLVKSAVQKDRRIFMVTAPNAGLSRGMLHKHDRNR